MGKRDRFALLVAAVAAILAILSAGLRPFSVPLVAAQSPGPVNTAGLAFEVASVKPNNSPDGERNGNVVGRRFMLTYATLRDLIQFAYQRPDGICATTERSLADPAGSPQTTSISPRRQARCLAGLMPPGRPRALRHLAKWPQSTASDS